MSTVDFGSLSPAQQEDLLNGPALAPPANVVSDFVNPPNEDTLARVVIGIALAIATICVMLRSYAVWLVVKKIHISDYMIIPVYGLYVAFTAVLFCETNVGFLVHQWNFRLRDVPPLLHLFNTATNIFAVDIMLMKASILLEWLRIFVPKGERGYFFWICNILLVVNCLFYTAGIIALDLTCIPFRKTWDRTLPGKCIDSKGLDITSATISLVIDLTILVLPQKKIWSLHLSLKKKIGVAAVFAVGIFGCVAAAFRLVVTVEYLEGQDVTFDFSRVTLWVLVEMTSGLIIFCVPMLPMAFNGIRSTGILSLPKSWPSKVSSYNEVQSWSQGAPKRSRLRPDQYRELDETVNISLHDLNSGPSPRDLESGEQTKHTMPTESGILRTTHLVTTISPAGDGPDPLGNAPKHQSPWDRESM
ncbi:hypothetical protein GGR53DRAFT_479376 [Hypoxylon sp. FL1150]|nr:hypothetical protein GGR53DRAFT_479376 [Hypoxylon sp. FL1150]